MSYLLALSDEMKSTICDRIKAARIHAKLTQEKLGELIGVSKSAVSMWETHNPKKKTTPTPDNIKLISAYTGAPISWLMSDSSEINGNWKEAADVVMFPVKNENITNIAAEAAQLISEMPPEEQQKLIHYLRTRAQMG